SNHSNTPLGKTNSKTCFSSFVIVIIVIKLITIIIPYFLLLVKLRMTRKNEICKKTMFCVDNFVNMYS
ncbi:MAG: hypothetical protein V1891_01575, partial [bacterium]